jgi:hypothetical protein
MGRYPVPLAANHSMRLYECTLYVPVRVRSGPEGSPPPPPPGGSPCAEMSSAPARLLLLKSYILANSTCQAVAGNRANAKSPLLVYVA